MFNFLKNEIENSFLSNFELYHSTTGDGRLDSAESEIVIIEHLKSLFSENKNIEATTSLPQKITKAKFQEENLKNKKQTILFLNRREKKKKNNK